jgi:hypothetical protein
VSEFQPDVLIQQADALAFSGAMILKASEWGQSSPIPADFA